MALSLLQPDPNASEAAKLIYELKQIAIDGLINADTQIQTLNGKASVGYGSQDGAAYTPDLAQTILTKTYVPYAIGTNPIPANLPNIGAMPTVPSPLIIAHEPVYKQTKDNFDALQQGWIAKYFPDAVPDLAQFNDMLKNIFKGTTADQAKADLNQLASNANAALKSAFDDLLNQLNTAIATQQSRLFANANDARAGVVDALTALLGNAQTLAWQQARDQLVREGARREAAVLTTWAARGFSLPGGATAAQISQSRQVTQDSVTAAALEQAIRKQQLLIDQAKIKTDAYLTLLQQQANQEIASFNAVSGANIRRAELVLQQNQFAVKIASDNLGLRLDFSKFAADEAVKYRLGIMNSLEGLVNAYAGLNRSADSQISTLADAQRANYNTLLEFYRAGIQFSEIQLRSDIAKNDSTHKQAATVANYLSTAVNHKVQAASTAANAYAQSAASALSGLNGVASVVNQLTQ